MNATALSTMGMPPLSRRKLIPCPGVMFITIATVAALKARISSRRSFLRENFSSFNQALPQLTSAQALPVPSAVISVSAASSSVISVTIVTEDYSLVSLRMRTRKFILFTLRCTPEGEPKRINESTLHSVESSLYPLIMQPKQEPHFHSCYCCCRSHNEKELL